VRKVGEKCKRTSRRKIFAIFLLLNDLRPRKQAELAPWENSREFPRRLPKAASLNGKKSCPGGELRQQFGTAVSRALGKKTL
jgi:hypothetical protein